MKYFLGTNIRKGEVSSFLLDLKAEANKSKNAIAHIHYGDKYMDINTDVENNVYGAAIKLGMLYNGNVVTQEKAIKKTVNEAFPEGFYAEIN